MKLSAINDQYHIAMQAIVEETLIHLVEPPERIAIIERLPPCAVDGVSLEIQANFTTDATLSSASIRVAIPNGMDSSIEVVNGDRIPLGINSNLPTERLIYSFPDVTQLHQNLNAVLERGAQFKMRRPKL